MPGAKGVVAVADETLQVSGNADNSRQQSHDAGVYTVTSSPCLIASSMCSKIMLV